MEAMQVIEKHAEHTPNPAVKLLDCSQSPEVVALGNLSDAQLIDLLRSDPGNALYLLAFYHAHAGLVRALLASEGKSENLNRWIWFSVFRTLTDSQKTVTPVAGWLGRIVALSLINRELPPIQGELPIPLAWYLHQSLEMMPIPLRITAVMGEIAKSTDKEISQFFHLRQMPLSDVEVAQLRNESHRFFVDRIPVDARRLYFGDPLDVKSPIQLLPSLGIDVQSEIQHFERWHGVQVDSSVPPIATPSQTKDIQQESKSTEALPIPALLGLLLLVGGFVFALVSAPPQSTVSPPLSVDTIPSVAVSSTQEQNVPEATNATISPGKSDSVATESAAIPRAKSDLASTSTTVTSSAKSVPERTISSTKLPETTVLPKIKPIAKVAAKSPTPVIISNGQLPLLDDAPRNRPPRFFTVMVADPQKKSLLSVRRFEPGSYYRSLQGKPWIQVGAYDTLAKANSAMEEFKARGFTVTIGRT
jgi:hypothetical protein